MTSDDEEIDLDQQYSGQDLYTELNELLDSDPDIDELGLVISANTADINPDAASNKDVSQSCLPPAFYLQSHKLAIAFAAISALYTYAGNIFRQYKSSTLDSDITTQTSLIQSTRVILLINADHYTSWNIRKSLFSKSFLSYEQELAFVSLVLSKHPKSGDAWLHRRWIITEGKKSLSWINEEIKLCERSSNHYPRNYFAWSHRMWCVKQMSQAELLIEWAQMTKWNDTHIGDHSGFHHNQVIIQEIIKKLPESEGNTFLLNAMSALTSLQSIYPGHESMWLYRRVLIKIYIKKIGAQQIDLEIKKLETEEDGNLSNHNDWTDLVDGMISSLRAEFAFIQMCLNEEDIVDYDAQQRFALAHHVYVLECVYLWAYQDSSKHIHSLLYSLPEAQLKVYTKAVAAARAVQLFPNSQFWISRINMCNLPTFDYDINIGLKSR